MPSCPLDWFLLILLSDKFPACKGMMKNVLHRITSKLVASHNFKIEYAQLTIGNTGHI